MRKQPMTPRPIWAALPLCLLALALLAMPVQAETWEDLTPDAFTEFTPTLPTNDNSAGPTVLAVQWMLERAGFAPGVMDGYWGSNTAHAVRAFQKAEGMEVSGVVDQSTWDALAAAAGQESGSVSPLASHTVSEETAAGPFQETPEDYIEQAELECLCFESLQEAVAEELHTTQETLARLNPDVDFASLSAGDSVMGPAVGGADQERGEGGDVASLVISKDEFWLRALDAEGNLVYHFPTTVGEGYDPSPDGEFEITGIATDPTFHYQPKLFSDVDNSKPDKMLPAGPNNPVGVVWMSLSKDNYGIHGTSDPASIGHTTSHGCVRLTNWDADFLAQRVGQGTAVTFTGGGNGQAASAEEAGDSD